MRHRVNYQGKENAQVIPLVVISLAVLIMMVALLLDGGALMLNRRTAQNAADAGALAGARELCMGNGENAAITAAINYAVTENGATSATAVVSYDEVEKGEVIVNVLWEQDSFFARIFNKNTLSSGAVAGAGCFNPASHTVLPIAWSCRAPFGGGGSMSEDCEYVKLDWPTQAKPIVDDWGPSETSISTHLFSSFSNSIYIIMDSDKICGVDVDCDFNNDGRPELETGGNRGWLNLTGESSGTPNLTGWIEDGVDEPIYIHTWLSVIDGNKTPVYTSLETRIGDIVWLPVFNWICEDLPEDDATCEANAHASASPGLPLEPGDVERVVTGNPATPLFHIVGFAPFYITCVHKSGNGCPAFNMARSINPSIKANTNTVEGYFISGYPFPEGEVEPGGVDLGNYIVSLTR